MKKGINTFAGYQEDRQAARTALIEKYLKTLPKRAKFELVTDLAEKVAEFVAGQEADRRPCSKVTILRNPKYRGMIDAHMQSQKGGTPGKHRAGGSDSEISTALLVAQVEAANLKRENLRLKSYIESRLKTGPSEGDSSKPNGDQSARDEIDALEIKLTRTCQTIMAILENMQSSLAISKEECTIIDLSRIRNNAVVGSPYTEPFFEWLSATQSKLGS